MNAKLLAAFLALISLAGCGGYYGHDGHSDPAPPPAPMPHASPGDVTFTWSFGGLDCSQMPDVRGVRVSIPGETLLNDGYFACQTDGYPGITLADFVPGAYTYTLEAYDYRNTILFYGAGSFHVNGDVRVTTDLTPYGAPSSYAYISWYFPPNEVAQVPSCAQAKVGYVDVRIDDGDWERFDCALGFEQPGIQTAFLEPGVHRIEMVALDSTWLYPTHSFIGTLTTSANAPVASDYQLQWEVGGASIAWELRDSHGALSCGQAGISWVAVHLMDEQGNWIYGSTGDVHGCTSAPIVYNYLAPGTYRVYLEASGPDGYYFLSNDAAPPVLTVQAGVFPTAGGALEIAMYPD